MTWCLRSTTPSQVCCSAGWTSKVIARLSAHSLTCLEVHPLASSIRMYFGTPRCLNHILSMPFVSSSAVSPFRMRMAQKRVAWSTIVSTHWRPLISRFFLWQLVFQGQVPLGNCWIFTLDPVGVNLDALVELNGSFWCAWRRSRSPPAARWSRRTWRRSQVGPTAQLYHWSTPDQP